MELEHSNNLMDLSTEVNLRMTIYKDKALKYGQMVGNMKEVGGKI